MRFYFILLAWCVVGPSLACKQRTTSEVKTLDNFAASVDGQTNYECDAPSSRSLTQFQGNFTIEGDVSLDDVAAVLDRVRPGFVDFVFGEDYMNAELRVVTSAHDECVEAYASRFPDKQTVKALVLKSNAKLDACLDKDKTGRARLVVAADRHRLPNNLLDVLGLLADEFGRRDMTASGLTPKAESATFKAFKTSLALDFLDDIEASRGKYERAKWNDILGADFVARSSAERRRLYDLRNPAHADFASFVLSHAFSSHYHCQKQARDVAQRDFPATVATFRHFAQELDSFARTITVEHLAAPEDEGGESFGLRGGYNQRPIQWGRGGIFNPVNWVRGVYWAGRTTYRVVRFPFTGRWYDQATYGNAAPSSGYASPQTAGFSSCGAVVQ